MVRALQVHAFAARCARTPGVSCLGSTPSLKISPMTTIQVLFESLATKKGSPPSEISAWSEREQFCACQNPPGKRSCPPRFLRVCALSLSIRFPTTLISSCVYTLCVPLSSAQGGEAAQTYGVDLDSNTRERGGTTSPRRRAWTGREEDRRRAQCSWPASYIRAFGRPCLRPPQRP